MYALSFGLDGTPRSARRIVTPYRFAGKPQIGRAFGDLWVQGTLASAGTGGALPPPYHGFLLRIRHDTPEGATLTVD
jgi:hypothetical protein